MSPAHPSSRSLEDFVLGRLDLPDNHRIVRHLLTGCVRCRETTTGVWERLEEGLRAARKQPSATEAPDSDRYDKILDRAIADAAARGAELGRERARARLLFDQLMSHPVPRMITLVRNSRRFRSWALCELLLDASFAQRFDDPERSLDLAGIALEVAQRVPEEEHGSALRRDLEARTWAYLGNARRIASDLPGADEAFREARWRLAEGTGDPLEMALLIRFQAHLEVARRRFRAAAGLYDQARALYRRCGESQSEAMVLLDKGYMHVTADEPAKAIRLLEEGLIRLDQRSEPRRALAARHNLVVCLNETGRHEEALARIEELRPAYRELGDRLSLLRLRWLEGNVFNNLGWVDQAEEALDDACQGFVRQGVGYEAASVALDLASLYVATGRPAEASSLAAQMVPIFESRRVEREVLAAIALQRTAGRQLTLDMIRKLAERLRRAR